MPTTTHSGQMEIQLFKGYRKKRLLGFADIVTPGGMIIHGLSVHERNGGRWIGLPSRPFEKDGKASWAPIIEFVDRESADAFREAVLAAFDRYGQGDRA